MSGWGNEECRIVPIVETESRCFKNPISRVEVRRSSVKAGAFGGGGGGGNES